jgi:hypothetical protein
MGMRIVAVVLSLCAASLAAEPERVTLDVKRNWEPIVYGTNQQNPPADVVSIDLKGEFAKFCSYDADKWGTFQYRLHIPTDIDKLPIVVMRYRATNLDTDSPVTALYVDNSPTGSLSMRPVAQLSELVSDGKDQELRVDLRDHQLRDVYSGFMICLVAKEKQTATMEITDIRLEAAPDAESAQHPDEQPIQINVTDAKGKPVAGANVTLDAERKDAARSGKTDASGGVLLTPVPNETGRHMAQIEGDYLATTFIEIPQETKDRITVQLQPGTIYSGIIQNEQGKPIEGATVRVFAPPPDHAPPTAPNVIRRAVVRTDKQGRWQSPVMPDEGKDPMFKLAHPDYVCDKEYNDTPLPPIDELKSGIGVMVLKKP